MSGEFIDLNIILKHFLNKWASKYKINHSIPSDLIERQFQVDDFTFIWNLSSTRFINLRFINLISENDYIMVDG
jgi:hypothetical protein